MKKKSFIELFKYNLRKKYAFILIFLSFCFSGKQNIIKGPKISIFLPIYNKEHYITKSIQSIQKQTLKNIEIIAVNDNSNDGTLNKLISMQKTDSRIKIVNNKRNRGLLYSRAMGILNSSGEYLMNVDPDDKLASDDSLEYLYNKAKKMDVDIISFTAFSMKNNENIIKCSNEHKIERQPSLFKSIFCKNNAIDDYLIWNKLIKKEIYQKAFEAFKKEIYNGKWNYVEDDIWSILVNKYAKLKICTKRVIYIYNNYNDSLMSNRFTKIEYLNLLYRHEMYKKLFNTKENEKYLIKEYYLLFNRLKEQVKYLLLLNDNTLNAKISNVFIFFLNNYNPSISQKRDINNFLEEIKK